MEERGKGSVGTAGDVYSHSRLSAFERCPRKFQYRYLWKIPAEGESIEGFVGKRVHEVLERLHRVSEQHGAPSLPKVLWRFQQMFAEAYDASRVRIARQGTPLDFYRELGEQCLANYYREHYPFDRDETLALEEHVSFDLDGSGSYAVQGFVDRIARTRDGAIEIQDYKTSARVPSQAQADEDRQLALYQIGVGARHHRCLLGRVDHGRLAGGLADDQIRVVVAQRRDAFDPEAHTRKPSPVVAREEPASFAQRAEGERRPSGGRIPPSQRSNGGIAFALPPYAN